MSQGPRTGSPRPLLEGGRVMDDRRNVEGYVDPTPEPILRRETQEARKRLATFIKCALALANAMGIQVTCEITCRDRSTGVEWRR